MTMSCFQPVSEPLTQSIQFEGLAGFQVQSLNTRLSSERVFGTFPAWTALLLALPIMLCFPSINPSSVFILLFSNDPTVSSTLCFSLLSPSFYWLTQFLSILLSSISSFIHPPCHPSFFHFFVLSLNPILLPSTSPLRRASSPPFPPLLILSVLLPSFPLSCHVSAPLIHGGRGGGGGGGGRGGGWFQHCFTFFGPGSSVRVLYSQCCEHADISI